ncbi:helix-turn-helix domain-containing protein [Microbispora rosea]|uniref:helix-turn-helix domain-containing protein n=1 Tax=Microbispora rosea TaxID=58117 RepID=UPI0037C76F1F
MRIYRTSRDRFFTVIGNEVLRDTRLSFLARGVLAYLLSLADGVREDVRTLADNNPGVGRRGISKALDELEAAGYYVRTTTRDPQTGRVTTLTAVYDTPQVKPITGTPGTGEALAGNTGSNPKGFKNLREETPTPQGDEAAPAVEAEPVGGGREDSRETDNPNDDEHQGDDGPGNGPAVEADRFADVLPLFGRLRQRDGRLTFSPAEIRSLAPLVVEWRSRGVADAGIVEALTVGLPAEIKSPAALVRSRLTRKMPAPVAPRPAVVPLVDCEGDCGRTAPRGKTMCGDCETGRQGVTVPAASSRGFEAFRAARQALLNVRRPVALPA